MDKDKIIAYLNNDKAEFNKVEVEQWIKENKAEYEKIKYVWEKSGVKTEEEPDMADAWKKISENIQHSGSKENKKIKILVTRFQRIAAALILLFSIGTVFYYQHANNNATRETTLLITENKTNEIKKVLLADGTEVWLNNGSKLSYPKEFTEKTREIYLEGEAFFDVAHNKRKPFMVHTGNSITKVLGTSFNVKQEKSGDVQVTVVTGRVSLSDKENNQEEAILLKGDAGVFSEQNRRVKKYLNEDANFLAWKTGKLTFVKTPLADVCEILSKQYNKQIRLSDSALQKLNLSADYDNKSIEEILEVMQLTLNIKYQNQDSCVVLYPMN